MPLLDLQGVSDQAIRRGLDSLNSFSEEGFYEPFIPAGIWSDATLVRVTIGGTGMDSSAWLLPATPNTRMVSATPLPPKWVSGLVGLRIFYSGTAASTNNITFNYRLNPAVLGVAPNFGSSTFTAPGPAAIGARLHVDIPTPVAVDSSATWVDWKVARITPDAYAGDVWIFGVRPLWYPRRG